MSQQLYKLGLVETDLQRIQVYEGVIDGVKKWYASETGRKGYSLSIARNEQKKLEQDIWDIVARLQHPYKLATSVSYDQMPYSVGAFSQVALKGKAADGKLKVKKMIADAGSF